MIYDKLKSKIYYLKNKKHFDRMKNYDLDKMIEEAIHEIPTNLTWDEPENGVWKGWTYNVEKNRYYFDDIGNESLTGLWSDSFLEKGEV
jgi:hypothetical protein